MQVPAWTQGENIDRHSHRAWHGRRLWPSQCSVSNRAAFHLESPSLRSVLRIEASDDFTAAPGVHRPAEVYGVADDCGLAPALSDLRTPDDGLAFLRPSAQQAGLRRCPVAERSLKAWPVRAVLHSFDVGRERPRGNRASP